MVFSMPGGPESRRAAPFGCWSSAAHRPPAPSPWHPYEAARPIRRALDCRGTRRPFRAVVGMFFGHVEAASKRSDDFADQNLRRRGTRSNSEHARFSDPLPIDVAGAFDQPCGDAEALRDFGEAERIAAVGRADDEHPIALRSDRFHCRLAVRGSVANILAARRANLGEPRL